MNKHLKAQELKTGMQGGPARKMPGVKPEGPCKAERMARVSVSELDGTELYGNARLVMGSGGKPERLEVRGGIMPNGNVLIARTGNAEYVLTLEADGKELRVNSRTSGDGMVLVLEFRIASAMRVRGSQRASEDPMSWGDVIAETELDELRAELEGVIAGKASALTREEILGAEFRFTDGSRVEGRVLFGERASVHPGCIKSEWEKGRKKLIDALRVKGEHGVNCFLIKGNLQSVADISPAFVDVAGNPNAFTVEISGHRYAGVMA